jgi:hypothetical protein
VSFYISRDTQVDQDRLARAIGFCRAECSCGARLNSPFPFRHLFPFPFRPHLFTLPFRPCPESSTTNNPDRRRSNSLMPSILPAPRGPPSLRAGAMQDVRRSGDLASAQATPPPRRPPQPPDDLPQFCSDLPTSSSPASSSGHSLLLQIWRLSETWDTPLRLARRPPSLASISLSAAIPFPPLFFRSPETTGAYKVHTQSATRQVAEHPLLGGGFV